MIRRALAPVVCFLILAPAARAAPVAKGKVKVADTTLAISGGNIENGEGTLRLQGKLEVAGTTLRGLQVDLRTNGLVTAIVDGLRQPVFTVNTAKAKVGKNPTKIRIRGVRLVPTGALDGGGRLSLSVSATPDRLLVAGGQTTLALDQTFRDALTAELVTPGANEGAVIDDAGRAQFPISRGRIYLDGKRSGTIDHGGGLSFAKENFVELRLTDFKLKPGPAPKLLARVNESVNRVAIATVALEPLTYGPHQALIADSLASLTPEGSSALNTELGTDRFTAGAALGLITVDAVIQ